MEIAAMRALAVVAGVDRPRMIASGRDHLGDWLLTPYYSGIPLDIGAQMPTAVWATLARVHRHWLRRRPRGIPVVDARWWQTLCERRILPALAGAARRSPDKVFSSAAEVVTELAREARMIGALALLPKTLVHGDVHRGNILRDPDPDPDPDSDDATILDWGNAKVAPAGLDLAVLRAQGAAQSPCYRAHLAEGRGQGDRRLLEVERHWADVHIHVAYLGFAAEHLGSDRVGSMIEAATSALTRLGAALSELR